MCDRVVKLFHGESYRVLWKPEWEVSMLSVGGGGGERGPFMNHRTCKQSIRRNVSGEERESSPDRGNSLGKGLEGRDHARCCGHGRMLWRC